MKPIQGEVFTTVDNTNDIVRVTYMITLNYSKEMKRDEDNS